MSSGGGNCGGLVFIYGATLLIWLLLFGASPVVCTYASPSRSLSLNLLICRRYIHSSDTYYQVVSSHWKSTLQLQTPRRLMRVISILYFASPGSALILVAGRIASAVKTSIIGRTAT